MREKDFRDTLRSLGKKQRVMDELVLSVALFETYLRDNYGETLEEATEDHLSSYLSAIDSSNIRFAMRGLAIYYSSIGRGKIAALAREIGQRLASTIQRAFRLRDFRGIDPKHISALEAFGIKSNRSILEQGKTPGARKELASRTGVPEDVILELVKLSDLSRLPGVKSIRARLFFDAGIETVEALSEYQPEELMEVLKHFMAQTDFKGSSPLLESVQGTINMARTLPRLIDYV